MGAGKTGMANKGLTNRSIVDVLPLGERDKTNNISMNPLVTSSNDTLIHHHKGYLPNLTYNPYYPHSENRILRLISYPLYTFFCMTNPYLLCI